MPIPAARCHPGIRCQRKYGCGAWQCGACKVVLDGRGAPDTHIVQRVGKSTAIVHDLDALENGQALPSSIDVGQIKPGTHIKFQYGEDCGSGTDTPFNQKLSDEIRAEMTAWANEHITNAKGRDTFFQHLDPATKSMVRPVSRKRAHESVELCK